MFLTYFQGGGPLSRKALLSNARMHLGAPSLAPKNLQTQLQCYTRPRDPAAAGHANQSRRGSSGHLLVIVPCRSSSYRQARVPSSTEAIAAGGGAFCRE